MSKIEALLKLNQMFPLWGGEKLWSSICKRALPAYVAGYYF